MKTFPCASRHLNCLLLLVAQAGTAQTPINSEGEFVEQWRLGGFGSWIGISGLTVGDFDRDGQTEIFGSASTYVENWPADFWFVLEHNPETGAYDRQWVSGQGAAEIWRTAAIQVDPLQPFKLVVSYESGLMEVYDGATYRLEAVLDQAVSESVLLLQSGSSSRPM